MLHNPGGDSRMAGQHSLRGLVCAATAALALLGSTGDAHGQVLLPNLRAQRAPAKPWVIRAEGVSVEVQPISRRGSAAWARWGLDIEIGVADGLDVVSVSTMTPGVDLVVAESIDRAAPLHGLRLEVAAPRMCLVSQARQPVQLSIVYDVNGSRRETTVDVDHRCLLGDVVAGFDASAYATLAAKYLDDPLIEDLVARAAPFAGTTPEAEIARVRDWMGFDQDSTQADPPDFAPGWRAGTAYALSPTETGRLGGDCEDWSILAAAFLARRGYASAIAETFGHVWVVAGALAPSGASSPIDLLGEAPPWAPSSIASVRKDADAMTLSFMPTFL